MTGLARSSGHAGAWLSAGDCNLEDFREKVERSTELEDYPFADRVLLGVPVYDGERLRKELTGGAVRRDLQGELAGAFADGPGIVILKNGFADLSVIDRATELFDTMLAEQEAAGAQTGDYFAKPGANGRIWGALEKLALRDPRLFADYYSNDLLAAFIEAWLGPQYQITSAINVVNPGSAAQSPHRDFHLGFMSAESASHFPVQVHRLSPALTLQAAIAHCDMPQETGPTFYLPYSQTYLQGYIAALLPQFRDYVEAHKVQPPLEKGDIAFFNPAVFHGAGHNRSADVKRMANLLQVSSAFGRAMESIDREAMSEALFPTLMSLKHSGTDPDLLKNVVAASAEAYAFPTNLDRYQPADKLSPETQAELVWRALEEEWSPDRLAEGLDSQRRQRASR
jgi:ectoine hydroxylase-related dioxygenase (phytanoyl-CoA dioxygenase family)